MNRQLLHGLAATDQLVIIVPLLIPLFNMLIIKLGRHMPGMRDMLTLLLAGLLWFDLCMLMDFLLHSGVSPTQHIPLFPGLVLAFKATPLGLYTAGVIAALWGAVSLYLSSYIQPSHHRDSGDIYYPLLLWVSATMGIALSDNLLTLFLFSLLAMGTGARPISLPSNTSHAIVKNYSLAAVILSAIFLLPVMIWLMLQGDGSHFGIDHFDSNGMIDTNNQAIAVSLMLFLLISGLVIAPFLPLYHLLTRKIVTIQLFLPFSALTAGLIALLKAVIYIFGLDYLQHISAPNLPYFSWSSLISCFIILLFSVMALREERLLQRLGKLTVIQLAMFMLAICLFTINGVIIALLQLVAAGTALAVLFFATGVYSTALPTSVKIVDMAGIGRRHPWILAAFTLASLSLAGLPLTIGFMVKYTLLSLLFKQQLIPAALVLATATLLNGLSLLQIIIELSLPNTQQLPLFCKVPLIMRSVTILMALILLAMVGEFGYLSLWLEHLMVNL